MSIVRFQQRAVALKINGLPVVGRKDPVAARLLQAAAQRTGLIASGGRAGCAGVLALPVRVSVDVRAIGGARFVRGVALASYVSSLALPCCANACARLALCALAAGLPAAACSCA